MIVLLITTIESVLWSYVIFTHCSWIQKSRHKERRKISYNSLRVTSIITGTISFFFWIMFVYLTSKSFHCLLAFVLIIIMQIGICVFWHIISSFLLISLHNIPIPSKYFVIFFNKVFGTNYKMEPVSVKVWEEIKNERNILLYKLIDIVPDMIWIKDNEGKYTYANTAISEDYFKTPIVGIIGHTVDEMAEKLERRGIYFNYTELEKDTDEEVLMSRMPMIFHEQGTIDNEHLVLRVLKSPIIDENDKVVGIIGVARNISYHAKTYEEIEDLYNAGELKKALDKFMVYKRRFDAMKDIKHIDKFQKGMR